MKKLLGCFKRLKLAQKISLLVIVLIIIAVGVSVSVSGSWYIDRMLENLEQNALNVVTITAMSPVVVDGLESGVDDGSIQAFVHAEQESLEQIDIMVVADINSVRYGHTKSDRVGELFSAEDHADALTKGTTYVTIGPGTLGDSLRAFTPVWSRDKSKILGFVMSGTLLDSIEQAKRAVGLMLVGFIALGCAVGVGGAVGLSRYIKKSLLSYEPEDIARLYLENQGILATVHEGVIAIDRECRITLINDTAEKYLSQSEDCAGQDIRKVFPLSKLPEVLISREALLNVPYALGSRLVMSNNIPIIDKKGAVVGGVCSFRDQTEMNKLADEMTGVKKIVDALRATTHEFKNKLHVILGFVETGRYDQAKCYIGATNEELQATVSEILNAVCEPTIAALCIGKSQRAHELGQLWELDDGSDFANTQDIDTNALVVILGNLLDNAIEALDSSDEQEKRVSLYINDEADCLTIAVSDNGPGIADCDRLFDKGYTTKSGSRGYGLFLVKEQVDKYLGEIKVSSEKGAGTRFTVKLKRGRGDAK